MHTTHSVTALCSLPLSCWGTLPGLTSSVDIKLVASMTPCGLVGGTDVSVQPVTAAGVTARVEDCSVQTTLSGVTTRITPTAVVEQECCSDLYCCAGWGCWARAESGNCCGHSMLSYSVYVIVPTSRQVVCHSVSVLMAVSSRNAKVTYRPFDRL